MDPVPARYLIRINGHLGATMLSAFPSSESSPYEASAASKAGGS